MTLRIAASLLGMAVTLALSACVFRDVTQQQAKLDAFCTISGTVEAPSADDAPIVVLLVRTEGPGPMTLESIRLADHFVREGSGRWMFYTGPGTYGLAAFEDRSRDLVYRPGEPFLRVNLSGLIDCEPGSRFEDMTLVIPEGGRPRLDGELDVPAMQARTPDDQLRLSLGMVTAAGDVASLDDARFAEKVGSDGMWRPFDFLVEANPGVYFLQEYDAGKTPVLFVHGANGTPRNFRYLIDHLDKRTFQPWVYYYPSGIRLNAAAAHLDQTMMKLRRRFGFDEVIVVAHSMGGLVARAFVLLHPDARGADIPVLLTIATPWNGHSAAQLGVDRAPAVVRSWFDMAPGSPFLTRLYFVDREGGTERISLPDGVSHHLLFAFRRNSASFGVSDDEVAAVASQLRWDAQEDARRLYGFDETHMGVLFAEPVAALVNDILADAAR